MLPARARSRVLTFSLAQEVAAEGIRVVGISPGIIETEFLPPGQLEQIGPMLPMKRAGKADEVAEVIVWALSRQGILRLSNQHRCDWRTLTPYARGGN